MMRTALVGLGNWGSRLLPHIGKHSDLACIVTSKPSESLPPSLRSLVYPTLDQALAECDLEAVFVAVPPHRHAPEARLALEGGKHVFVEKPGGENLEQVRELSVLARDQDRRLAVGYQFVHSPCLGYLQSQFKDRVEVAIDWLKTGTFDVPIERNLGSHSIACLVRLFGTPISCSRTRFGRSTPLDVLHMTMEWESAAATIYVNRTSDIRHHAACFDLGDRQFIWSGERISRLDENRQTWNTEFESSHDLVELEVQAFLRSCELGSPNPADGELAVAVAEVLEKVRQAL